MGIGATDGSPATQLNIGDEISNFQIVDGGSVVHAGRKFHCRGKSCFGGNTIALLADNGAGTETKANSTGISTPSALADPQNTPSVNTPTDGTNNQINNTVTVSEGARAIIR